MPRFDTWTPSISSDDQAGYISSYRNKVMVQPGILPRTLPIHPLKRISPSRFVSLGECALREVWTANRQPLLLPASPVAKLGTAIHKLLELAGKGQLGEGTAQEVESVWTLLVEQVEREMQASWLEKSLVPLKKAIPDYEVRKIRACRRAEEIAQAASTFHGSAENGSTDRFELWVQSNDGLIGGSIDHVRETEEGLILRDYKSGYVMHKDELTGELKVKQGYQVQLKLYAALYETTFGQWPVRLEIIPLQGENITISFNPSECTELLNKVVASLYQVNRKIAEISQFDSTVANIDLLALPTPNNCRFCSFRPACKAYQQIRNISDSCGWPRDVWGSVIKIQNLGNGKLNLNLELSNYPNKSINIRGLDPNPARHPALQIIQTGDQVALYNLLGNGSTGAFLEKFSTVVYRFSPREQNECGS
ncbi:PD-(D/E)XK nuclease family protein [Trichocoleus sp. FACHB-90]|uniref:RecB family exonuclease n=1 Tax=Cyanophyceae TaxID=3028117 RepID=UPI001689F17A|nr:PD-(D/E)XK nuclease family protein [Trichocoleus sp. FACHB-90]MBD1929828.1 PD-(D/E)XK nuclease family protein [Trichocoleus sp. FACHB-90]